MSDHNCFVYRGRNTREIVFPLGGIGTGSIGLAGNGQLVDWEIYNHPNKGSLNGFSHFAIRSERDEQVIDARVLHGDLHPPYSGSLNGPNFNSFGFGPSRETMAGLPHFRETVFTGAFPLTQIDFIDDSFPGSVHMSAFNPFIPLNNFDSSIPAAFFEIEVRNTTPEPLTYILVGTLSNPLPANNIHTVYEEVGRTYLHLRSDSPDSAGDLTLGIEGENLSSQAYWFRGAWFDSLEVYWLDLTQHPGGLRPRSYPTGKAGAGNAGSLASRFALEPGETRAVRFVIAWSFPFVENTWNADENKAAQAKGIPTRWKNYYATQFENSFASAQYAFEQRGRLLAETRLFKDALYSSDLEPIVLEAVAANLAVLKSATVLRLEDGTFYGFEGCHITSGCCEGSCTHVWNYAQAAPFLFPSLERSMRAADFDFNQRADGGMRFRLPLPEGITAEDYWVFHPCADGQFGDVLKAYADWKLSGDTGWLRRCWPAIKKAISFAWAPSNEYRWDPDQSGVLRGRMHHTLDMELFGPSAWLNGLYLAALKAGAEMASTIGEAETAQTFSEIFERGKAWTDAHLFNGEYYFQQIDLSDRSLPEQFGAADTYWDAEHSQIKYQIGEGCEIDQLLGQWHANLYGLGEIFDPGQARTALESLFRYNFRRPIRDFYNPCRLFALNDEAGLVLCAWPGQTRKPVIPVPYSQEAWTGLEYAAASLMIQSGMVQEGLAVVEAVRARYDGEKRNPWNEIECGSHYARSMAAYALLPAFSGFAFDLPHGMIGFNPIQAKDGRFQCFWSVGSGWGMYRKSAEQIELEVLYGTLSVQRLQLPFLRPDQVEGVSLSGPRAEIKTPPVRQAAPDIQENMLVFTSPVELAQGSRLTITLRSLSS